MRVWDHCCIFFISFFLSSFLSKKTPFFPSGIWPEMGLENSVSPWLGSFPGRSLQNGETDVAGLRSHQTTGGPTTILQLVHTVWRAPAPSRVNDR